MNPADVFRLKTDIVFLAACYAGKTIIDAKHIPSMTCRLVDNAGNHTVDAWCRTTAADDGNDIFDTDHGISPFVFVTLLSFALFPKNPAFVDELL